MNDLEPKSSPVGEAMDLNQQCAALQRLTSWLLVAMVVMSGTFAVFLYQAQRYSIFDRDAGKQIVGEAMQVFRQQKPQFDHFVEQLKEYSKTHPDFTPLLTKYGYGPAPALMPAAGTPAPATAVPKPATPSAAAPKK